MYQNMNQDNIKLIVDECNIHGLTEPAQKAYILATAQWETNHTLEPVREAYWLSEEWRERGLPYYPYYGRGFVQLTHKSNYRAMGEIMSLDLVRKPDLALEASNAAFILVHGMCEGVFTGKRLDQYVNHDRVDFYNARRVVNGLDKAQTIADIAEDWMKTGYVTIPPGKDENEFHGFAKIFTDLFAMEKTLEDNIGKLHEIVYDLSAMQESLGACISKLHDIYEHGE